MTDMEVLKELGAGIYEYSPNGKVVARGKVSASIDWRSDDPCYAGLTICIDDTVFDDEKLDTPKSHLAYYRLVADILCAIQDSLSKELEKEIKV